MARKAFSTGLAPRRNRDLILPAESEDAAPIRLNVQQVQGTVTNRFESTMASMQAVIELACSMISAEWARARVTDIITKAKTVDQEWQTLAEPDRIALEPMLTDTAHLLEGQLIECYRMSGDQNRAETAQPEAQSLARKVMETVCPKYRPSVADGAE